MRGKVELVDKVNPFWKLNWETILLSEGTTIFKYFKLEAVAAFSGMTIPAFCRWFKQAVGLSFVSYLHQVRIEKACHFLIQTDWRVSEIAFRTGFESLSHFNRTFKKLKMTSPSAYRKMLGGPKNSKTNRA
jgi:AraC-like DNA-binding protein